MSYFKRIAVGLSGGIDSAVSALLLKRKGFDVIGVHMKNWDDRDDSGVCSDTKDAEDAKWVCNRLEIPYKEVSFVKEYWNHVFEDLIAHYNVGMTPNPDILCNEFIKFGSFYRYCIQNLNVDAIATGHYAQSSYGPFLEMFDSSEPVKLVRAVDDRKDQTFFLSRISQTVLQRCMFPVGVMKKSDVRQIGEDNEFHRNLKRKESSGICFIEPQTFQRFLSRYVLDKPGKIVDVDTMKIVGDHRGIHHWTIGQRCLKNYYVVDNDGKDVIFVGLRRDHPALYCRSLVLTDEHWIVEKPKELLETPLFKCQVRYMHGKPLKDCHLVDLPDSDMILLDVDEPLYAVAPGQFAVFYLDDVCIGCARIIFNGPSDVSLPSAHSSTDREEDNSCI
ncbi:hypothetical protein V9T40_014245 [Parthenolecanium corni]|uniref:tRNA-5-taurinomethyluridine 2-sulfurtransferase n=1 Tax=Parthenolecanium corni TaxID=536013 RepID=A0AAN9TQK8_9HEMI